MTFMAPPFDLVGRTVGWPRWRDKQRRLCGNAARLSTSPTIGLRLTAITWSRSAPARFAAADLTRGTRRVRLLSGQDGHLHRGRWELTDTLHLERVVVRRVSPDDAFLLPTYIRVYAIEQSLSY
jgi:hypothetical protein